MKSLVTIIASLACVFLATNLASAQSKVRPQGFDDFKLVKTRNIFDPNRRAVRGESARESRSSSARIIRANTLSLTGTMVAEGRTLAFFSGSRSEYNKVIGIGESVADYKVKAITTTEVELEHGGKATALSVGKALTLEGSVEIPADSEPAADASLETSSAAPPAGAAGPPAPSNDKNEVLRRMMERRAKEMNK